METSKKVLSNLPLFQSLSSDELDLVLKLTKEVKFKDGDIVFREGDPGGTLYIVLTGSVRISAIVNHDLEKPLVTMKEGAIFGEVSLIDHNPRETRATAIEDSELMELDTVDFETLLEKHPATGTKILKFLTRAVVDRIRFTTDLYRRSIQWGLSVSGALKVNWHQLITDEIEICLELTNGKSIQGTFVKVEQGASNYEFFLKTREQKIFIIPYHSVSSISLRREDTRAPRKIIDDET